MFYVKNYFTSVLKEFLKNEENIAEHCDCMSIETVSLTIIWNFTVFVFKRLFFVVGLQFRQMAKFQSSCLRDCWTRCLICLHNVCEEAPFPPLLRFKRKHWVINIDIIRLESSSPWYFKQIPVVLFNVEIHFACLHALWQTLRPNKPALIGCHCLMEIHSVPVFARLIDALSMFTDFIADL